MLYIITAIIGFIIGALFARRNLKKVEAALVDARNVGLEFEQQAKKAWEYADTTVEKLRKELEEKTSKKPRGRKKSV